MKRIAAITMARNDEFFLNRWISYYGGLIGNQNLYIYLDGLDQKTPAKAIGSTVTKLPHQDGLTRASGDKYRISLLSDLAKNLFAAGYDIVIGCDCDEFLIVDPSTHKTLPEYLSTLNIKNTVSGLGLDVGQDLNTEKTLDPTKPFLDQRDFALLSTRYTKPVVLNRPIRWGSGFHSVKKHNFHIDKNLYLLHFGSVDYEMIKNKIGDRAPDWEKHLARRAETIHIITNKKNRSQSFIKLARTLQTLVRPIYAWTKPSQFGLKLVTKIPDLFKKYGI